MVAPVDRARVTILTIGVLLARCARADGAPRRGEDENCDDEQERDDPHDGLLEPDATCNSWAVALYGACRDGSRDDAAGHRIHCHVFAASATMVTHHRVPGRAHENRDDTVDFSDVARSNSTGAVFQYAVNFDGSRRRAMPASIVSTRRNSSCPLEHQGRAAGRHTLLGGGERSVVAHAAARFRIDAFSPMVVG
jgi:hypothetical protein